MTPVAALRAWLVLEHEAVWLFPVVGARFDPLTGRARASFEAHRDTRDAVVARLRTLGAEPSGPELTYDPGPLTTAAQATAAAQALEAGIAAATLALAGVAEADLRTDAIQSLTKAALAAQTWGAQPTTFPGLP